MLKARLYSLQIQFDNRIFLSFKKYPMVREKEVLQYDPF